MIEKIRKTSCGTIQYLINDFNEKSKIALIFLPGLTADHRLFDKQIEYFKNKFRVFVWDTPGHGGILSF